jgi:RimJ/RimL family protein N-acetyltransferase
VIPAVRERLSANIKAMDPEAMLRTWQPATLKGFEQLQEMFLSRMGGAGAVAVALRTRRLLLRPWRDENIAAFVEMSSDLLVMEYLLPAGEGWVARARAHWDEHGFGQWAVELPGAASFIGVVAFEVPFTPAVEVAWRLARPYWGRGCATEAARGALDYGFDKLSEIVALTVPANQRSRRVMKRLGTSHSPEDDFDHPRVPDGPLKRHVLYRLRAQSRGEMSAWRRSWQPWVKGFTITVNNLFNGCAWKTSTSTNSLSPALEPSQWPPRE